MASPISSARREPQGQATGRPRIGPPAHRGPSAWRLLRWLFVAAAFVAVGTLAAAPFYVYSRFDAEQPIAELRFRLLSDRHYLASLATGDLCSVQTYELYGDQWQLDASFVKWRSIGTLLGLDSLYRLDRLSGRYASASDQNTATTLAHDVAPVVLFDPFARRGEHGLSGLLVDTHYGSSVYLDIDPSRRYRVYKTEDALIARAMEPETDVDRPGEVALVIDKACGRRSSPFGRWVAAFNAAAVSLL